jgi:hypothetical protein
MFITVNGKGWNADATQSVTRLFTGAIAERNTLQEPAELASASNG